MNRRYGTSWARAILGNEPIEVTYTGSTPKVGHPIGPNGSGIEVEYGYPGFVCIHPPDTDNNSVWVVKAFDHSLLGEAAAEITGGAGQIRVTDSSWVNFKDPQTDSTPWTLPVINATGQTITSGCKVQAHPVLGVGWCLWPALMGQGIVDDVTWTESNCTLSQTKRTAALYFYCGTNDGVAEDVLVGTTEQLITTTLSLDSCSIDYSTKDVCVLKSSNETSRSLAGTEITIDDALTLDSGGGNCTLDVTPITFCVLGTPTTEATTSVVTFTARNTVERVYEDLAATPKGIYQDRGTHYVPCFIAPSASLVAEYEECPAPNEESLFTTVIFSTPGTQAAGNLDSILFDPSGGTGTIELEASPIDGAMIHVKNTTTDTTNVTIDGNGNDVQNHSSGAYASTQVIGDANISITYIFNGTDNQWEVKGHAL